MIDEAGQKPPRTGAICRVGGQVSVNKGTDKPTPNSSLVIGCVPGSEITKVSRLVIGMLRSQRPEADGSEQMLGGDVEHSLPP